MGDFLKEINQLLIVNSSILFHKIIVLDVKEIEYQKYELTLKFKEDSIFKGIYINDKMLKKGQIILCCSIYLDKSNLSIQIDNNNIAISNNIEEEKNIEKYLKLKEYNLNSYNLADFFYKINGEKQKYQEDIFIINKKLDQKYELLSDIKINDFIYIKNYLLKKNDIICNNLSMIKKESDYEIFHLVEHKLHIQEKLVNIISKEIKPVESDKEITIKCLVAKVVLKDIKKSSIQIIDHLDRLIELEYDKYNNLDLFDLLIISNCKISKSKKDAFSYILVELSDSKIYSTKKLFFDKRIRINNYTLLYINFPDFQNNYNYYNTISINNQDFKIYNKIHIYKFFFINEAFNEIRPYIIECKNDKSDAKFKFFIVDNLLNKINLFINYQNEDKCCIDFCYYNLLTEVPFSYNQIINKKTYNIETYNSFDSINKISFILLNIPSDEDTRLIKEKTNINTVSSQIWFCAQKDLGNNNIIYIKNQILDVNEAKVKKYLKYELKQNFLIFENFYFDIIKLIKEKSKDIIQYIDNFSQNVHNYQEIYELLNEKSNVDYESYIDFLSFKIYIGISLFDASIKIEVENKNKREERLKHSIKFIKVFHDIAQELLLLKTKLTYHEKMRILNCSIYNYFNSIDKRRAKSKLIIFDNLDDNSSYKLALNFNINIIKNLTEKSALSQGFLQLDSYILKNYFIKESMSYSLCNEPLIMMKNHLLYNYEKFILIIYENPNNLCNLKARQDGRNRITCINEKSLFNDYDTENLEGQKYAIAISMEYFHEKDSHSKKSFKNLYIKSPLLCFKDSKIDILEEPEDGRFIESIIGSKELISNLKNPDNNLGELMNVDYFIKDNFNDLLSKYNELMNRNSASNDSSLNIPVDADKIKLPKTQNKEKKKESELVTLEDFEEYYLFKGNFIYPDSLPFHHYFYGEKPPIISEGEKQYLKKYESVIKRAKEAHYNNKLNY